MLQTLILLLAFQDPAVQEQIKVRFVLLDVAVFDSEGQPVTDLTKDDFTVVDDSEEMEVTYFAVEDRRRRFSYEDDVVPAKDGVLPANPLAVPLPKIVLVLDFEPLDDERARAAFDQTKRFLRSLGGEVRYQIQLFASDKRVLGNTWETLPERAIRALEEYERWFFGVRERQVDWAEQRRHFGTTEAMDRAYGDSSRAAFVGSVDNMGELVDALRLCMRRKGPIARYYFDKCECVDLVYDFVAEQKARTDVLLRDIEKMVADLDDRDTMKALFLLTPGFLRKDVYAIPQLAFFFRAVGCNKRIPRDIEPVRMTHGDFDDLYATCAENRVTFYSFDIDDPEPSQPSLGGELRVRGQSLNIMMSQHDHENTFSMKEMAEETGGAFLEFDKDVPMASNLTQVLLDYRHMYALGYNAPEAGTGDYRKVRIKVSRGGLELRYRRGYYDR